MSKYKLTDETKIVDGRTLYRIVALKDFSDVKKGDLGGFIENEKNLLHEGACWVYDFACVYDKALISNNAKVYDFASVYGDSTIFNKVKIFNRVRVYGRAIVKDNVELSDYAEIYDNARITLNAKVHGHARVFGNAKVSDNAEIWDYAQVFGDAFISGKAKVFENAVVKGSASMVENSTLRGSATLSGHIELIFHAVVSDDVELNSCEQVYTSNFVDFAEHNDSITAYRMNEHIVVENIDSTLTLSYLKDLLDLYKNRKTEDDVYIEFLDTQYNRIVNFFKEA